MVDQSDMIVSYVPQLPNGKPGLSSGVERELHHAFEGGKEVYVVWACKGIPSPFITETATRVFRSLGAKVESACCCWPTASQRRCTLATASCAASPSPR